MKLSRHAAQKFSLLLSMVFAMNSSSAEASQQLPRKITHHKQDMLVLLQKRLHISQRKSMMTAVQEKAALSMTPYMHLLPARQQVSAAMKQVKNGSGKKLTEETLISLQEQQQLQETAVISASLKPSRKVTADSDYIRSIKVTSSTLFSFLMQ